MLGTLLMVVMVIAIGSRAGDNLRVRQQEIILSKLPEPEKLAYYDILRRRVRRINFLRAVALVSLVVLAYAYKNHLAARAPLGGRAPTPSAAPR